MNFEDIQIENEGGNEKFDKIIESLIEKKEKHISDKEIDPDVPMETVMISDYFPRTENPATQEKSMEDFYVYLQGKFGQAEVSPHTTDNRYDHKEYIQMGDGYRIDVYFDRDSKKPVGFYMRGPDTIENESVNIP